MHHGEGVIQAPAGTVVPQELLEEMLWFFRVEDGKWQGIGVWGMCSQHKTQNTNCTLAEGLDVVPLLHSRLHICFKEGTEAGGGSVPRRVWLNLTLLFSGLGHSSIQSFTSI